MSGFEESGGAEAMHDGWLFDLKLRIEKKQCLRVSMAEDPLDIWKSFLPK